LSTTVLTAQAAPACLDFVISVARRF